MGARTRLNTLYAMFALATAAVIGAVTSSWELFLIAAVITLGAMFSDSRIRVNPVRRLKTTSRWKSRRPPR